MFGINDENQVTIAGKGGIDAVVECMRRHGDSPTVYEEACRAVRSGIQRREQGAMRSAGVVALADAALMRHPNHAGTQEEAKD